jgi:hypothetical protein
MGLSSIGMMVMDSNREDAGFINRSFSGVDALVNLVVDNFVSCTRIARSRLLGSTKQGSMSESGKSDHEQWAEMVSNYQADVIAPYICRLTDLVMASGGDRPEYEITFPSILVRSELDKAQTYKTYAEADEKYNAIGLPGNVILESRFKGNDFNTTITLDEDELMSIEQSENDNQNQEQNESPAMLEDSDKLVSIGSSIDLPLSDTEYESILKLLEMGEDLEE